MQTRFGRAKGENLGHLNTNKIWAGQGENLGHCKHHFFGNLFKCYKIGRGKGGKFRSLKIQTRFGQAKGKNLSHCKHHFFGFFFKIGTGKEGNLSYLNTARFGQLKPLSL